MSLMTDAGEAMPIQFPPCFGSRERLKGDHTNSDTASSLLEFFIHHLNGTEPLPCKKGM